MSVILKKTVAVLKGVCTADEAEILLSWLQENSGGKINLKYCRHVHSAVLQVLMAAGPVVSSPPVEESMAAWLLPAMSQDDPGQDSDPVE